MKRAGRKKQVSVIWGGNSIPRCKEIYTPFCEIYTPCEEIYSPCGEIYTPCGEIYTPCGEIYTPCGESFTPCGEIYTPLLGNIPPYGRSPRTHMAGFPGRLRQLGVDVGLQVRMLWELVAGGSSTA